MLNNQLNSLDPHDLHQQHFRTTPGATLSPQGSAKPLEVDFVVKNVYQKIKSLENKYIDLANFYKESSKVDQTDLSKLPRNLNQATSQTQQESSMIRDLYEKKKDLEDNIQSLKTAVQLQKTDPSLQMGQMKHTKRVLSVAFAEVSNSVESAQTQCLKALAQKQNEMFQMATKHKVSSAFRNETLGLWYDTKSMLAQSFSEIKQAVIYHQHQSDQQLGLNFVFQPKDQVLPALDHTQLQEVNDQIYKFSRRQQKQKKELAKIQSNFEKSLNELKNDHQNLQNLMEELNFSQEDSSLTRKRTIDKSVYLSPFQRKLQTYSNPALGQGVLNSQKRSASKGTASQQKIQPTTSAQNLQSKSTRALTTEDNGATSTKNKDSASFTRGQLDHLKSAIKVYGLSNMRQQTLSEDLINLTSKTTEENSNFFNKMQELLQQTRDPNQVDKNDRLQELQQQNEQIYSELRQFNEKYIDLRVENSQLRDQIFSLQNSRPQQHVQADKQNLAKGGEFDHRNLLDQMCDHVNRFMSAMRQLQKAVNRKDSDIAGPKEQFESQKQTLQALVVDIREFISNKGPLNNLQQQYQSATRLQAPATSNSPLRDKRPTVSSSQLNKLPMLLQNVKNLQLEKQKMQELITELKKAHVFDLEQLQLKAKQKSERLQKFAAQCTYFQIKQQAQDQLLVDYRQIIISQDNKLSQQLLIREKQLEERILEEVQRIQPSLRIDPQVAALREELVNSIKGKTQIFEGQIEMLCGQLKLKEEGLNRLKILFVEKLHELETTFVEISNEVAETEQQHQQQAQQKRTPNQFERSVETVLSKFESDEREKDIEQLAQLNAELLEQNSHLKQAMQLMDLQKKEPDAQTAAKLEFVFELQDQLDTQKSLFEKQITRSKELEQSETLLKKEIQTLKYDNKRNQMDLKDARERFEKAKNEYQAQFNGLKMTILSQKQQVDKEFELRLVAEQSQKSLKNDISSIQTQKVLRETENKNLLEDLDVLKDQLRAQLQDSNDNQKELNEQIEIAQKEIEQLKLQIYELNTNALRHDDPIETTEIVNSYMDALLKGSQNEIAVGDFTDSQLIRLIVELQGNWLLQKQELQSLSMQNSEMGVQIQELQTELKETSAETLENQLKINQLQQVTDTYIPTTLSLQSQLDESRNLQDFKQKEVEAMSEKLGRVNQESCDQKGRINQLQETVEMIKVENQDLQTRLKQAEMKHLAAKDEIQAEQTKSLEIWENKLKVSKRKSNLLACLHLRVREILLRKIQEFEAQNTQTQKDLSLTLQDLSDTKVNNEEIQAQIKHLNTKLILEKERNSELEVRAKRVDISASDDGFNANGNLVQKFHEASKMLEDLKLQHQELKKSSDQRINEAIESEQKTKVELQAKYKAEMSQFLTKAVDDRRKIQNQYDEEVKQLKIQIEQLKQSSEKLNQEIDALKQLLDTRDQQHANERDALVKREASAQSVLNDTKVELADLLETKNSLVAQFEEELRQAEQAHTDLQTQLENEYLARSEADKLLIQQLRAANGIFQTKVSSLSQVQVASNEVMKSGQNDYKKVSLAFALASHMRRLLQAKFDQLSLDFENQSVFSQNLEQTAQQAEYKQVQQEGELKRLQDEFTKYKQDANKLMMDNLRRQSELKKTDEAKNQEIAALREYQSNLQEQIGDYAAQLSKQELEIEKLLEHVQELQTELNTKEQQIKQSLSQKQQSSPEKPNLHEKKIKELLDLVKQYEESIAQVKSENEKLKKTPEEKRNSWEFQNSGGRGSWGSNGASVSNEVEDVLKHIRQIMTTFLARLPFTTKENEDLLPILFSMLQFKQNELESLTSQRDELNKEISKTKANETSKNIFGFGKKKQQKN